MIQNVCVCDCVHYLSVACASYITIFFQMSTTWLSIIDLGIELLNLAPSPGTSICVCSKNCGKVSTNLPIEKTITNHTEIHYVASLFAFGHCF